MLEPMWQQSASKTVEGWPVKFSALLDSENLQQHGFCTLMPKETNLSNQQEFLKEFLLHSNQGSPAQDLVGSIFCYAAVAHNQDCDSNMYKQSTALGKRPASVLSRQFRRSVTPRCVYFRVMCKLEREHS